MVKDSFFDTNVVIFYADSSKNTKNALMKRCYEYIANKDGKFILCYTAIRELLNVALKRARIHKEILIKIEDINYDLEKSSLTKRDMPFAKKLYEQYKDKDKEELLKQFTEDRKVFDIKIEQFIKAKIDEKVIPVEQINTELVGIIRDIIENYADCQILSSALQYQKDKEPFLFVTADNKDFSPNQYDYLKEYFGINYSKENYKFPELKNLHFENSQPN